MVDFAKHLKNPGSRNSSPQRGELIAWIKKNSAPASEAKQRTCEWEIRPYASMHGEWIVLYITKGGVTGYESITLEDEKAIHEHTIEWIFGKDRKFWTACAGGMGWDEMRVPIEQLRSIINQWMETQDVLLSLCMICEKIYDRKSAKGAPGGVSHGYCDGCSED